MSRGTYKIEGGQGGKRGHSNMSHWDKTEIIKADTKILRRNHGKNVCRNAKFGIFEDDEADGGSYQPIQQH